MLTGALTLLAVTALGEPACVAVQVALPARSAPRPGDLHPAECPANPASGFRYDKLLRTVQTLRDLAPGDVVRGPPSFAVPDVRPGDVAVLVARVGPVTVRREVRALQPARPGQRLFVQAADGEVFSVPFSEIER